MTDQSDTTQDTDQAAGDQSSTEQRTSVEEHIREQEGQPEGRSGERSDRRRESITDLLTKPRTKAYVKFFTGIYAIVGLAVGFSLVLVGAFGGPPLSPDLSGTVSNVLESNVNNVDAILAQMHLNRLASQAVNAAPLLAALLGVGTGAYVGTRLDASDREAYANAGASAGVGSFVLVAVVGFLASTQIAPLPTPKLADDAQQLQPQSQLATDAGLGVIEGVPSAILVGGTNLSLNALLVDAAVVGVAVAVFAVAGVYVVRNFKPEV